MKNCNNQKFNIHFPQRDYNFRQQQQVQDQTPLIIGLSFMSVMLFGLVIILAIVKF